MPPFSGGGAAEGGGATRAIPKKTGDSFIYWDMLTKPDGSKMKPGDAATVKNQGYGGAGLDLTVGTGGGDGSIVACSGPTGGGVDCGGTAGSNGSISTSGTAAPQPDDDVVMSLAFRFRAGYGTGSPILWTKSYIAIGAAWGAPYNAAGFSLHAGLTGATDYNVNVGGVNNGVPLADRYTTQVDTDYWLDLVKRADGTAAVFINATKVASFAPGLLTDYGAGEWMLGGNVHTANDSCNGQIYFAELVTLRLTDDQIIARAKAWLGWA